MLPHALPEVSLGVTPALHSVQTPCSLTENSRAGRAGSPWRESPQVRRQSALQTNLGPYIEPVLDPGPWVGGASHYQKAGASTHKGECKPLDHLPVPSKRTAAQDGSWFCGSLGKCVFSSSSLRACSRRWSSPLEAGFRRARALGALPLPPSKSSSLEQEQSAFPLQHRDPGGRTGLPRPLRPELLAPLSELQSGLRGHLR